jgi:trans-aconitate methyltransferase
MCEGYNGEELIKKLSKYIKQNSTVLELGMGPGTDLEILNKTYLATGSDYSQIFINQYLKRSPKADLLLLNALTMNTDRKFKCIFSNKVLHHFAKNDLKQSVKSQLNTLEDGGIVFHTFWSGDKEENLHGMRFTYYNEQHLKKIFEQDYEILELSSYTEMEENDSIYVIAKKR